MAPSALAVSVGVAVLYGLVQESSSTTDSNPLLLHTPAVVPSECLKPSEWNGCNGKEDCRCQSRFVPQQHIAQHTGNLGEGDDSSQGDAMLSEYCVGRCTDNLSFPWRGCCQSGIMKAINIHCLHGDCKGAHGAAAADRNEVALVTMGSLDRAIALEETLARWSGPVTAVFSVDNRLGQISNLAERISIMRARCKYWRKNVDVYAAIFPKLDPTESGADNMFARHAFPTNALRNVAMDRASAPWALMIDMDFVPSATLYVTLKKTVLSRAAHMDRIAIVVPQWEWTLCRNAFPPRNATPEEIHHQLLKRMPANLAALKDAIRTKDARPFLGTLKQVGLTGTALHSAGISASASSDSHDCGSEGRDVRNTFPQGVILNKYPEWLAASNTNAAGLLFIDQTFAQRRDSSKFGGLGTTWEPYVVLRTHGAPRYAEELIGRARDKATFTIQLQAAKYTFYSLLREFLLHFPHDNLSNTPRGRAGRRALKQMNVRNTALQRKLVSELEQAHSTIPTPPGWGTDTGFTCSECKCCGRRLSNQL